MFRIQRTDDPSSLFELRRGTQMMDDKGILSIENNSQTRERVAGLFDFRFLSAVSLADWILDLRYSVDLIMKLHLKYLAEPAEHTALF